MEQSVFIQWKNSLVENHCHGHFRDVVENYTFPFLWVPQPINLIMVCTYVRLCLRKCDHFWPDCTSQLPSYRLWNKLPKMENMPSIAIDNAVLSPNVTFVRWKVHQDWVTQVTIYLSLSETYQETCDTVSARAMQQQIYLPYAQIILK